MTPALSGLLIRWAHLAAFALLLGGAILLWGLSRTSRSLEPAEHGRLMLLAAERYETLFWAAIGLIVATGAGNLGAFGGALPGRETVWGLRLTIKLAAVLTFLLLSLLRTLLIVRLKAAGVGVAALPLAKFLQTLYVGTALLTISILGLAVWLAHG